MNFDNNDNDDDKISEHFNPDIHTNIKWTKQLGKNLIKDSSIELSDILGKITKTKYKSCSECNILIEDICNVCKIKCTTNDLIKLYDNNFRCKMCGVVLGVICGDCKVYKYEQINHLQINHNNERSVNELTDKLDKTMNKIMNKTKPQ